jgi:hypothetical protein
MSHLTEQQLPATCVVVRQLEWTFHVQLRHKRKMLYQHLCSDFSQLVHHVTWYEFQSIARKKDLFTYLQDGIRYERLSYEQALALAKAA